MTEPRLTISALLAYGSVRMPLALLELPLFVLLPILYNRSFGMELAVIGAVLFAARAADAIADPLIGMTLDRTRLRFDFSRWIRCGLPLLVLAFGALLLPPVRGNALAVWLAVCSIVAYFAYSIVSIAHQSWGASLSQDPQQQVRLTTTREAFGLVGVLLAIVLLSPEHTAKLAFICLLLAVIAGIWSLWAPKPVNREPRRTAGVDDQGNARPGWARVRGNLPFRWLMAAFVCNGVATAVPATLVLFFAADVLKADTAQSALFLGVYFLCAAIGMPFWLWLSRRHGARNTWLIGIAIAVLGFVWTLGLGAGDFRAFTLVCAATGFALGSDLAMPPALLASVIAANGDRGAQEGRYFGLWNLATKMNLALAAGIALPMIEWLGQAWSIGHALALSLIYAALPSVLKLLAGFVLLISPLPVSGPSLQLSESTT